VAPDILFSGKLFDIKILDGIEQSPLSQPRFGAFFRL